MKLTRLRYFIELANCLNFTVAASKLYTSQPNLSKQIFALEKEIGITLFKRTKKEVILTPAGKALFDLIKNIPDTIDNAIKQASLVSSLDKDCITIGVLEQQDLSDTILPHIQNFLKTHPDTAFNLERHSFKDLRSGLNSGYFDFIITLRFDVEGIEGLKHAVVMRQPGAIVLPKNHPLSNEKQLSLSQLRDESFILISTNETQNGIINFFRICSEFGFVPKLAHRPESLDDVILSVEAGMGVALLDQNVNLSSHSRLCVLPIIDIEPVEFVAVWKKDFENKKVEQLISILELK